MVNRFLNYYSREYCSIVKLVSIICRKLGKMGGDLLENLCVRLSNSKDRATGLSSC